LLVKDEFPQSESRPGDEAQRQDAVENMDVQVEASPHVLFLQWSHGDGAVENAARDC
jgi:hypothetical protein